MYLKKVTETTVSPPFLFLGMSNKPCLHQHPTLDKNLINIITLHDIKNPILAIYHTNVPSILDLMNVQSYIHGKENIILRKQSLPFIKLHHGSAPLSHVATADDER